MDLLLVNLQKPCGLVSTFQKTLSAPTLPERSCEQSMTSYFGRKNDSVKDSCVLVECHTQFFLSLQELIFLHTYFLPHIPDLSAFIRVKKIHPSFDVFNGIYQGFGADMFYFLSNEILPFVVGHLVLPPMRYAKPNTNWNPNTMSVRLSVG